MFRAHINDGVVWVTGASSGIGRGVALELARRGFRVAATARRDDELRKLESETAGDLGHVRAYPGDVSDAAGIAKVVEKIEAEQGPIALAFLNVGTYVPDGPDTVVGEGFRKTFELNIGGTANCLAPVLKMMEGRKRGQIVITASVAGFGGLPRATAYGATKAALINMAESLRLTLAPSGITVQVVNPGFVETPLTAGNTFPMPFLVPLDKAVKRICDGFQAGGFEITFPKRLSWVLKGINMLPYPAYFWLVERGTRGRAGQ